MEFEKINLSNNDCKSKENLYGIILAGVGQREFAYAEPAGSEPNQSDPYAKFIDGQSLLELTLRRVKKAISPKRVFVLVNRNHLAVDEARGQVIDRGHHTILWKPRRADTMPSLFLALMRIYNRCRDAIVTLFPVDHFVAPECHFLSHLRMAWRALDADGDGAGIVLLGMEPQSPDLGYCYIVPERSVENTSHESFARIALVGQAPRTQTAQKLIDRGALWHSGIIVAKCSALIDLIRRTLPALYDSYPVVAESSESPQESDRFEEVCRDLPAMTFAGILRALPWDHRRRLHVLPVRGVYWNQLSNQRRQEECLEKIIGVGATTRLASAVA